jgi:cell division protein ZapB
MDLNLLLRLEEKFDQLLACKHALEEDCRRLASEKAALEQEKAQFVAELDRILAKLDGLDQENL